jgi:hypothetical protein
MSKDLWGDEPFRDGQPELNNGQWSQQETYTPVPENTIRAARAIQKQEAQVLHDEIDIDDLMEKAGEEDSDDDFTEALSDASLRLEQGNLYKLVMNHALFDGLDADPRAIKSVQKQIRKFAKEQMETMLGMRQEAAAVTHVSSPFSSLEARALKDIAFQLITAKNMKEEDYPEEVVESTPVQAPKKKTLNTIGKQQTKPAPKPIAKKAEPIQRQTKPKPRLDLPPEMEPDYEPLSKPISQMSAAELAERDRQATERQKNRMVITPKEQRAHWPSYEEQTMLAQQQVSRAVGTPSKGNLSALIMSNLQRAGKI